MAGYPANWNRISGTSLVFTHPSIVSSCLGCSWAYGKKVGPRKLESPQSTRQWKLRDRTYVISFESVPARDRRTDRHPPIAKSPYNIAELDRKMQNIKVGVTYFDSHVSCLRTVIDGFPWWRHFYNFLWNHWVLFCDTVYVGVQPSILDVLMMFTFTCIRVQTGILTPFFTYLSSGLIRQVGSSTPR